MGKKLIIRGADFSANGIAIPVKTLPWNPETYWNNVQSPIRSYKDLLQAPSAQYNLFSLGYDKYLSYYQNKKLIGIRINVGAGRVYFKLRKIKVDATTAYSEAITIDQTFESAGWYDIMFDDIFDTTGGYFLAIEFDSEINPNIYWSIGNDAALPDATAEQKAAFRTTANQINDFNGALTQAENKHAILYGFYTLE